MDNTVIDLKDEYGNNLKGKVLSVLEIDDVEYLLYSVSMNDEEDALFVKKIVKYANGDEDLVDIEDDNEREKIKIVVNDYIEHLN